MRHLYSLLFYLALPLVLLRLLWRSRKASGYRKNILERFGFAPTLTKCIWIHAVSVGETMTAVPLIKSLQTRYPNIPFLITNMTPTGAARVKAIFGETIAQTFIPYDLPIFLEIFLQRAKPVAAIIMETELWPNLFFKCHKKNIPVFILNARLSEKSSRRYERISFLCRPMFEAVRKIAAQSRADAERFIQLGLPNNKIVVTGNLKFEVEIPEELEKNKMFLRERLGNDKLIWIAASTHPTEEEIILAAHQQVRQQFKDALLIIVPRHPERFEFVAELIKKFAFKISRRSDLQFFQDAAVYLGDSMGELLLLYSVSDLAFIGGSFATIGGHNMLEAAVLGKPIVTGPNLYNFVEISSLLLHSQGMKIVNDSKTLANAVIDFFSDKKYREQTGEKAKKVVAANRGALQRQLALIEI